MLKQLDRSLKGETGEENNTPKKKKKAKKTTKERLSIPEMKKLSEFEENLFRFIDPDITKKEKKANPSPKEFDFSELYREYAAEKYIKIPSKISKEKDLLKIIPGLEEKIEKYEFKYNASEKLESYLPNLNFGAIQGLNSMNVVYGDDVNVTAETIAYFAHPIVEYIRQQKPDYIVACDRGARFLGLAVARLYNRLYGGLPTVDGTMRFRKISKSKARESTKEYLRPLVEEMTAAKERPKVLVLDDWVCSGGTKKLAKELFDELSGGKVKLKFGVLLGQGADVSGEESKTSSFAGTTDWRDDSNIIGVAYADSDYLANAGGDIQATPVRSPEAFAYRRRMYAAIDRYAKLIKEGKKPIQLHREPVEYKAESIYSLRF